MTGASPSNAGDGRRGASHEGTRGGGGPGTAGGRRPLLVGLTGGIGTGKSTVAQLLAERGAVVVDADRIARAVVEPGQPALAEIAQAFGREFLDEGGALRRDRLGAKVFSDPEARRRLEAIVHPYIERAIMDEIAAAPGDSVVVLDIPLLFETGRWVDRVDVILVVYADRETQIARLRARDGLSEQEAQQRIDAQWPTAVKLSRAHWVIYNQGDRDALVRQVDDLWRRLTSPISPAGGEGRTC